MTNLAIQLAFVSGLCFLVWLEVVMMREFLEFFSSASADEKPAASDSPPIPVALPVVLSTFSRSARLNPVGGLTAGAAPVAPGSFGDNIIQLHKERA